MRDQAVDLFDLGRIAYDAFPGEAAILLRNQEG